MLELLPIPETKTDTEIRQLTPEEIQTVKYVFDEKGVNLPDPATSMFVGAVKDGRVLGFIVLQLKLHAEPMWIETGHSQLFQSIVQKAEQVVLQKCGPQWVYLFAPAGRITQLAQTMGMQVEPYVVLSKLVMPSEPPHPVHFDLLDADPATEVTQ